MKSIRNFTRLLTLAVVAGSLLVARAEATPLISVSPVPDQIAGTNFSVDIVVSGLTEPTGAVSFLLFYDNSILQGLGFTPDPDNVMKTALDSLNNSSSFTGAPGSVHLDAFFTADVSLDPAALAAAEGTGFRVGRVDFKPLTPGLSPLTLSFVAPGGRFLSDYTGQIDLGATGISGSVCVRAAIGDSAAVDPCAAPSAVPEPATFGLLATGVAALVRRRRNAQK